MKSAQRQNRKLVFALARVVDDADAPSSLFILVRFFDQRVYTTLCTSEMVVFLSFALFVSFQYCKRKKI